MERTKCKGNIWKKLWILGLLCFIMILPVQAEETSEMDFQYFLERSIPYLKDTAEYGTEILLEIPAEEDVFLGDVTKAVTGKMTTALREIDEKIVAADYPLVPDSTDIAAMYWYNPEEKYCIYSSFELKEDILEMKMSFDFYETVDLGWLEVPFGLEVGAEEAIVLEAVSGMPFVHSISYENTVSEEVSYIVFLPEHEELEYLQLSLPNIEFLQMLQIYAETATAPPVQGCRFSKAGYHWKGTDGGKEVADLLLMISETVADTWLQDDETAVQEGFSWLRYTEDVLAGDKLLETEAWNSVLSRSHDTYDKVGIGYNAFDNHVEIIYDARGKQAVDMIRPWFE